MAEEALNQGSDENSQQTKSLSLLAREHFGSNFHGEVAEPEPPEQEPETEIQEEAVTEDSEVEESAEAPEEGEEEASTEEEQPISSLDELIEHYEWDPEWVNSINVPIKVDGKPSAVPLKELVDKHQMNAAADKRLEEAKARVQAQNQEFEQKSQELQEKFIQAGTLIENAEKLLDRDSNKVNWAQLREDDPAEYSAKKSEFAERRQEIDRMKQEAVDTYQKSMQDQQTQSQEQIQQIQQEELQKLVEEIPMKTQEAYNEWSANTAKYLMGSGFEKGELSNILDHRFYVLAHKARLYDEGMKKTDAAKKKVAKVPKAMKPGAAQSKQQADSSKVKAAQKRFKDNPTVENAFLLRKAKRGG